MTLKTARGAEHVVGRSCCDELILRYLVLYLLCPVSDNYVLDRVGVRLFFPTPHMWIIVARVILTCLSLEISVFQHDLRAEFRCLRSCHDLKMMLS